MSVAQHLYLSVFFHRIDTHWSDGINDEHFSMKDVVLDLFTIFLLVSKVIVFNKRLMEHESVYRYS